MPTILRLCFVYLLSLIILYTTAFLPHHGTHITNGESGMIS